MESTTCSTLAAAKELLLAAAGSNVLPTNPAELSALVGQITEIRNMCDGLELKVVRQVEVCEVAKAADASSTTSWLAEKQGIDPKQAAKKLALARNLERHLPAAEAALCVGEISVDQVQVIAPRSRNFPRKLRSERSTRRSPSTRRLSARLRCAGSATTFWTSSTPTSPTGSCRRS